jgi:branched-chain amino acid transport system permease protein
VTQVIINSLSGACLNLLIAVSFWLVYAPTRTFNISHGAAITFGAYGCYWFSYYVGLPLFAAACIATGVVAVCFVALDKVFFQTLRSGAKSWVGLVASIGVHIVLLNLVSLGFGDETKVLRSGPVVVGKKVVPHM